MGSKNLTINAETRGNKSTMLNPKTMPETHSKTAGSEVNPRELSLMVALFLVSITLIIIAAVPSLRTKVKNAFASEERQILAKVSGKISTVGPEFTVLKIKVQNTLSLEVFSNENQEGTLLIEKFNLEESRDGYVTLAGNATNLAFVDVDHDGAMEIVTPTYDEQMIPRLNIFKYNQDSKTFEKVNAPESKL